MTQIDFYHDAPDRLQVAARITQKAVDQGHRVVIHVPDAGLSNQIDRLLWSLQPTGFLPHCRADSALAPETPVLLATTLESMTAGDVLINLDRDVPDGFGRFRRLIEIVGESDTDKGPARDRYRHYRGSGYTITSHALGAKP